MSDEILTKAEIVSNPMMSLYNGRIIEVLPGKVRFTKPKLQWDEAANDWSFDVSDVWWSSASSVKEAEEMIKSDSGFSSKKFVRR